MTTTERAIAVQNVKVVMARIQDAPTVIASDLLWGFKNEAEDKERWKARYLTIFADVIVEDYLRGKLGVKGKVYVDHVLGRRDPVREEAAWRVQDDLETYLNTPGDSRISESIFEKVALAGPEYAGRFALAAVNFYFAVVRKNEASS